MIIEQMVMLEACPGDEDISDALLGHIICPKLKCLCVLCLV